MSRHWIGLVVAVSVISGALALPPQSLPLDRERARELRWAEGTFPAWARGNEAKRLAKALREGSASSTTLDTLLWQQRPDDALRVLRVAILADPRTLIEALTSAGHVSFAFTADASRNYTSALGDIAALARARLKDFAREDAARVEAALIDIDGVVTGTGTGNREARTRAFVDQYRGTSAALQAEVDLVSQSWDLARLDQLDQFWRSHPTSDAGAKALYVKAQISRSLVKAGSDPTERLLEVIAIVDELESGRYPDSDWVRRAPDLVIDFYVSDEPSTPYASGNIQRCLDAYQRFVEHHFRADGPEDPIDSPAGRVITSRMGALYERQGDRHGGIERTLTALQADGADQAEVDLFRAQLLLRRVQQTGPAQAGLMQNAERILVRLAAANGGYPSRKALGLLGGVYRSQKDYARARRVFTQFATQNASSPFAWIADLAVAQSLEAEGELTEAVAAYEGLATKYSQEPLAAVIGPSVAAQILEGRADFGRALNLYSRALQAWDADYGPDVVPPGTPASPAPTATEAVIVPRSITQPVLADRVAALDRNLSQSGGAALERGRWQLGQLQFATARATLHDAERLSGGATEIEARTLRHRAELELALEQLAVKGARPGDEAAQAVFEAIAAEPFDVNVGAAGVARAMLLFQQGKAPEARAILTSTFDAWLTAQAPLRSLAPTPIDADVAALRDVVFRPTGKLALLKQVQDTSHSVPSSVSYVILTPEVAVTTTNGQVAKRLLYQQLADFDKALFLTADERLLLVRVLLAIGKLQPTGPPADPNTGIDPDPDPQDIIQLLREFLPISQTSFRSWRAGRTLETNPKIYLIEFTNAERTRANVKVAFDYTGATIMLEKIDQQWRAIKVVNFWIS